jgi:hypothetical protein
VRRRRARHEAELEDERERRREKRVSDYREYLRTGIAQSGMGVRVPLLMADSDKDVQWVGPAVQITEPKSESQSVVDSEALKFDPAVYRPGLRTAAMVRDHLALARSKWWPALPAAQCHWRDERRGEGTRLWRRS